MPPQCTEAHRWRHARSCVVQDGVHLTSAGSRHSDGTSADTRTCHLHPGLSRLSDIHSSSLRSYGSCWRVSACTSHTHIRIRRSTPKCKPQTAVQTPLEAATSRGATERARREATLRDGKALHFTCVAHKSPPNHPSQNCGVRISAGKCDMRRVNLCFNCQCSRKYP